MVLRKIRWRHVRYHWEIYLFVLPAVIILGLFQYWPSFSGIFHSFYRWNGADISEFVGFDNFLDLVKTKMFWYSFELAFTLGTWEIIKMVPAILVAVCIHRCASTKMQFFYRAMFVVPMVIPGLIMVLLWRSFFFEATNGYLNKFLYSTGLIDVLVFMDKLLGWGGVFAEGQLPVWLGDPSLIVAACIIWGCPWVGSFAVLIYLAKLQGIDKCIYEAAEVDGVGWFSKFTKIEFPLIMSSIHITLVFVIIASIKAGGMIMALAGVQGGPGGKATVPVLFMFRKAFMEQRMGYACAIGLTLTAVIMLLQKSTNMMLVWSGMSKHRRLVFRVMFMLAAMAVIMTKHFVFPAAMVIVITFPYGIFIWLKDKIVDMLPSRQLSIKRDFRRGTGKIWHSIHDIFLRAFKHLSIWGVLGFALVPLALMGLVSLKTNPQFYAKPATLTFPLHWENWVTAYEQVAPSIANSIFISFSATILGVLMALLTAYFFARIKMPLSTIIWQAMLVLIMIPTIANLVPLFRILKSLNLLNTYTALILVGVAESLVGAIFILRRFISDIPHDLLEAAEIDGANHFQQMIKVVAPLSLPIIGTVALMQFIFQWNQFLLPLIVMRDQSKLPITVQLLRMSGAYFKLWGPLMAGYCLASIPVIILFSFSMKLFIKGLAEGGVKG